MECSGYRIQFPTKETIERRSVDQDEEWFIIEKDGRRERLRIHDYDKLYSVPGLYEAVVYDRLECSSPEMVVGLLKKAMQQSGEWPAPVRVLDFGAGNGIVGEYLDQDFDCRHLVGVDIIPEAKEASERDRPGLYDDFRVLDFCELPDEEEDRLNGYKFNTLVTVAALGFGDIPTLAFINAFNLLENDSWVAFNIRDKFLEEKDESGYYDTLEQMMGDCMEVTLTKKYRHRVSISGEDLIYHAIVGRKTGPAGETAPARA